MPDNMNIFDDSKRTEEQPKLAKKRSWALWGVVLALIVGNIVAIARVNITQAKLDKMSRSMNAAIVGLENEAHDLNVRADTNEAILLSEVDKTRKLAKTESQKATKLAERKAGEAVKKLAAEYEQQGKQFQTELGTMRNQTDQANSQISAMIDDVDVVRGDVAETQTDLDETRSELTSVKGDLGLQSGLIATNADQLTALRQLGERHYFEFAIPRDGKAYKVANIAVQLRKTRPNRGKFTLDVIADDQRVEKKDRTVNEPIQFYTSGSRQPYELVVNEVGKGKVVGYLSVPKVVRARLQGM